MSEIEQAGPVRILVNSAGVAPAARIIGRDGPMPLAAFERTIRVNLVGTFNLMRLAAAAMARLEPLADGVRVVAIAPGLFGTPLLLNMPQQVQDSLAATVPFPARFGRPEEYAALVLHVVQNPMLNGSVLRLDGALRMAAR